MVCSQQESGAAALLVCWLLGAVGMRVSAAEIHLLVRTKQRVVLRELLHSKNADPDSTYRGITPLGYTICNEVVVVVSTIS